MFNYIDRSRDAVAAGMLVNNGSSDDMSGMENRFTSLIIEGVVFVDIESSGDRTLVTVSFADQIPESGASRRRGHGVSNDFGNTESGSEDLRLWRVGGSIGFFERPEEEQQPVLR